MKYTTRYTVTVLHGKHDVWAYVNEVNGLVLHQFVEADKAENLLEGLRAANLKEKHMARGNKELWIFT